MCALSQNLVESILDAILTLCYGTCVINALHCAQCLRVDSFERSARRHMLPYCLTVCVGVRLRTLARYR